MVEFSRLDFKAGIEVVIFVSYIEPVFGYDRFDRILSAVQHKRVIQRTHREILGCKRFFQTFFKEASVRKLEYADKQWLSNIGDDIAFIIYSRDNAVMFVIICPQIRHIVLFAEESVTFLRG